MFIVPEKFRIVKGDKPLVFNLERLATTKEDGNNGAFYVPQRGKKSGRFFFVIASDGEGWEHVSVSIPSEKRCPTWEEMNYIKTVFWNEDNDVVVQFHPAKKDYVSNHEYCLHLWRSTTTKIETPKAILVGIPNKL